MGAVTSRSGSTLLPELHDAAPDPSASSVGVPDRRDGAVYLLPQGLRLAVDVALATHRPLLLRGEPGSGKSSLAAFLARNLRWRYYEHVVTSRTRATDLLWTFDAVRKLADASSLGSDARALRDIDYVEPGVLWWAFNRESARRRGAGPTEAPPSAHATEPSPEVNEQRLSGHAVVLVDEIDKADPDVPNGLLVPLGSREFRVAETGTVVLRAEPAQGVALNRSQHLVVLTTNEERDLPPAFLRRCVVHELTPPARDQLVDIARRHLQQAGEDLDAEQITLLERLADKVQELREQARRRSARPPSTAEYLDAVYACRELEITVGDARWPSIERLVLAKEQRSAAVWS